MTTLIEMIQVTKTYGEGNMKVTALHETNFQLNAGEFVAIVGPSGSGKTTFLTTLGQLQEASSWKDSSKGKRDWAFYLKKNKQIYASENLVLSSRLQI